MGLRVPFLHRHMQDTVVIVEEGNTPHPYCLRCDMLVQRAALNGLHINTTLCTKGAKRKPCRLSTEE